MKKATIVGTNYAGSTNHVREASRGVVTENGKILLCYETKNDQWMIPGGGREDGETGEECCARELAEETGFAVRPSSCVFEIDEYYEDWKYVTRYIFATACPFRNGIRRRPKPQPARSRGGLTSATLWTCFPAMPTGRKRTNRGGGSISGSSRP